MRERERKNDVVLMMFNIFPCLFDFYGYCYLTRNYLFINDQRERNRRYYYIKIFQLFAFQR